MVLNNFSETKKRLILLTVVFLMIVTAMFLLLRIVINEKDKNILDVKNTYIALNHKVDIYSNNTIRLFDLQNRKINDFEIISPTFDTIRIKDMVGDSNKLIICFDVHGCSRCIQALNEELKAVHDRVNMDDLYVLWKGATRKTIISHKNLYPFVTNQYLLSEDCDTALFNNIGAPTLFVMDSSMIIKCAYIADSFLSSVLTLPYLQTVGKRFFDWDEQLYETETHQCLDLSSHQIH